MMICTWNVRGAGKKGFPKVLSDLRSIYNFEVIAILEPRISGTRALKVVNKLGFSDRFLVEASGFQEVFGFCGMVLELNFKLWLALVILLRQLWLRGISFGSLLLSMLILVLY
jgi:hypothetical protein